MADTASLRLAGALLLAGGVVFTIGAFSPPSEQWTAPLTRSLQVIGEHRVAWFWIHGCFVVGVLLTMFGFTALAHGVRDVPSASLLAHLVAAAYTVGAVFWLVNIAFRSSVQVWAAAEVLRTGSVPAEYEVWRHWAGLLFSLYIILAYLATAGLGWLLLRTALVPRWAAWTTIALGVTGGGVIGMSVPLIVHVPLMLIGALLLLA